MVSSWSLARRRFLCYTMGQDRAECRSVDGGSAVLIATGVQHITSLWEREHLQVCYIQHSAHVHPLPPYVQDEERAPLCPTIQHPATQDCSHILSQSDRNTGCLIKSTNCIQTCAHVNITTTCVAYKVTGDSCMR